MWIWMKTKMKVVRHVQHNFTSISASRRLEASIHVFKDRNKLAVVPDLLSRLWSYV